LSTNFGVASPGSEIAVDKSAYHHLSHLDIAGGNPLFPTPIRKVVVAAAIKSDA
jgi:hypothetical protein